MPLVPIASQRVPRRWALVAEPAAGKSSLLARLATPMLVIDADDRFAEVAHLSQSSSVFCLPGIHEEGLQASAIDRKLRETMVENRKLGIRTIAVDSLTSIISLSNQRSLARIGDAAREGEKLNRNEPHVSRANDMELLQTSVSSWGTDVVWVWHDRPYSVDGVAKVRDSIPKSELPRILKVLNARLEIVAGERGGPRAIRIAWSRKEFQPGFQHLRDFVLRDRPENARSGDFWAGMPERIDQVLLTGVDPDSKKLFGSQEEAIAWASSAGKLTGERAKALYAEIRDQQRPSSAAEMFRLYQSAVLAEGAHAPVAA